MIKRYSLVATLILFAMVVSTNAYAQEAKQRNFGEIYTECGLGGMLFQHKKWAGLAALSNVIWDFGTTASSSALTTPDSCMGGKEEKMAAFIYHTYDALEQDLAKGYGEHLDTLMVLAGKNQSDAKFIEVLRQDLAQVIAQGDYAAKTRYQKAETLFGLVEKNISNS